MLGDAERPAELCARRARVGVCEFGDELRRNPGSALCVLEGIWLDGPAILVEVTRCRLDELVVLQPGGENLSADRIGKRDVRSDVETKPTVRPLRARRAARIDDIKLGPVVKPSQDVMKVDRMRLSRVRSPKDDQVGVLGLLVGARAAACPEDRRQTDDARSVSSSIAAIDVVAADDGASELLRDIVHLVGRLRAAEHAVGLRAVSVARVA